MIDTQLETTAGRKTALRSLLRLRRFEERTGELFADNEIPGFVHLYIGQEAVAVGATAALDENDYITSTHRGHGHCLGMGLDMKQMFAELMAREEGFNNGKGGSMHIADVDAGMLGANGVVGSGAPIVTGAGLTKRLKDEPGVGLAFYGDGGVSQGQVHEAITVAAAMDLPVIYLIESNNYVENMPIDKVFNNDQYTDFAAGYDIHAASVDGMDVRAVYDAVSEAKEHAVAGEGPALIQANTYRYKEHSEGIVPLDRDEELEEWQQRDPIRQFKSRLVERGELTDAEFEEIDQSVRETVEEAVEYARDSTEPAPESAYEDVFSEPAAARDIHYHRQRMEGQ